METLHKGAPAHLWVSMVLLARLTWSGKQRVCVKEFCFVCLAGNWLLSTLRTALGSIPAGLQMCTHVCTSTTSAAPVAQFSWMHNVYCCVCSCFLLPLILLYDGFQLSGCTSCLWSRLEVSLCPGAEKVGCGREGPAQPWSDRSVLSPYLTSSGSQVLFVGGGMGHTRMFVDTARAGKEESKSEITLSHYLVHLLLEPWTIWCLGHWDSHLELSGHREGANPFVELPGHHWNSCINPSPINLLTQGRNSISGPIAFLWVSGKECISSPRSSFWEI